MATMERRTERSISGKKRIRIREGKEGKEKKREERVRGSIGVGSKRSNGREARKGTK